jgi:hypothetical protein
MHVSIIHGCPGCLQGFSTTSVKVCSGGHMHDARERRTCRKSSCPCRPARRCCMRSSSLPPPSASLRSMILDARHQGRQGPWPSAAAPAHQLHLWYSIPSRNSLVSIPHHLPTPTQTNTYVCWKSHVWGLTHFLLQVHEPCGRLSCMHAECGRGGRHLGGDVVPVEEEEAPVVVPVRVRVRLVCGVASQQVQRCSRHEQLLLRGFVICVQITRLHATTQSVSKRKPKGHSRNNHSLSTLCKMVNK